MPPKSVTIGKCQSRIVTRLLRNATVESGAAAFQEWKRSIEADGQRQFEANGVSWLSFYELEVTAEVTGDVSHQPHA